MNISNDAERFDTTDAETFRNTGLVIQANVSWLFLLLYFFIPKMDANDIAVLLCVCAFLPLWYGFPFHFFYHVKLTEKQIYVKSLTRVSVIEISNIKEIYEAGFRSFGLGRVKKNSLFFPHQRASCVAALIFDDDSKFVFPYPLDQLEYFIQQVDRHRRQSSD